MHIMVTSAGCHHLWTLYSIDIPDNRYPWLVVVLSRLERFCVWSELVSRCHNTFHKPGHLKQISNTRPIPIHIPKTQHPLQPFQAFFLFSKHIFLSAERQIPQRPHVFLLLDTNKKTKTERLVLSLQRTWLNQCKYYFQPLDMIAFFYHSQHSSYIYFRLHLLSKKRKLKEGWTPFC